MSNTKTLTKQKSGRKSPLPRDPPRQSSSKSLSPKQKSPSKRSSDGGAIATAAAASRSLSPKRSSDGGAIATAAVAASSLSPPKLSKPKPIGSTGRSKSEGGKSKYAHVPSVPMSPKKATSSSSSSRKKTDPLESRSAHVRSVPLLPLEETSEEWEGERKRSSKSKNRLKALRSLSPVPSKRGSSGKSPTTGRSHSPKPPPDDDDDGSVRSRGSFFKKKKVSRASSHSDSKKSAEKRRQAFQRNSSARSVKLADMDVSMVPGGPSDEFDTEVARANSLGAGDLPPPPTALPKRSASAGLPSLRSEFGSGAGGGDRPSSSMAGQMTKNNKSFVQRVRSGGGTRNDSSGGSKSPVPRRGMMKAESKRFVSTMANTAKGGAGLAVKGVTGGAGLVAHTAKGGAGLAVKGVTGGAGLAVKGVTGGAGLAAKGAMGGAGLALKGAKGGAGLAVKGVSTGVGVVGGGAGLAVSKIKSAKSNLMGEHKRGDIDCNQMAIYGSDMYSIDFVAKEIQGVVKNPAIDTLVVEDLIMRRNDNLDQAAMRMIRKTALVPNDQPPNSKAIPDHLEMNVRLFSGEELAACDSDILGRDTTSDPYVVISIVPPKGPEIELGRTKHCPKTLNPTWNFQMSTVLPPESFKRNNSLSKSTFTLKFTLYDFDLVGDDDCMGVVQMKLEVPNKSCKACKEEPKWHAVPHDSAFKASGRIKFSAEWKSCYGESIPETADERSWKRLTFCDTITCLEDYKDLALGKKEFQSKVRKVLRQKGISKFPIKFETKVEMMNMDARDTIHLLNFLAADQTIIQFHLPDPNYDYDPTSSESKEKTLDIKKFPKLVVAKFNEVTMEWGDDAGPLLIHLKHGTKPKDKKKQKHTTLFQHCTSKLEQLAKKSFNYDPDDFESTGLGVDQNGDKNGGDPPGAAAESNSSLPEKISKKSEKKKETKKKKTKDDDNSDSTFNWDDHYANESGGLTAKTNPNSGNKEPKQKDDHHKKTKKRDDALEKTPSFRWDDYDGGYDSGATLNFDADSDDESDKEEKAKSTPIRNSKEKQPTPTTKSDASPWDAKTTAKINKLQAQKKHLKEVIDEATKLAPYSEEAKQQLAKRVPELFALEQKISDLMGLGAGNPAA